MRPAIACLSVLICLAAPSAARANNDSWNSPDDLTYISAGTATTDAYGVDPGEPVGAQAGCPALGKTAFWRLTGNGQPITLSTVDPGTTFNTVLSVLSGTPQSFNRIACNDDVAGDALHRSRLTFTSVRGRGYLIQVGGIDTCGPPLNPCPEKGRITLRATTQRPANDDRLAATALTTDVAGKADNTGATQEPGEILACGADPFAATIWHRWTAPAIGTATFKAEATFQDTVLAVYRADSGARVGCNDDGPGALAGRSELKVAVTAGDYLLQVGAHGTDSAATGQGSVTSLVGFTEDADGDGVDPPLPVAVTPTPVPTTTPPADRDGDGYPASVDCVDTDAAINPAKPDKPGDGIDQDCRDGDAKRAVLTAGIFGTWTAYAAYTRFDGFAINRAPKGLRIHITCRGGGCPFKSKTRTIKRETRRVDLLAVLSRAKLRPRATLEVQLTAGDAVGLVTTWTIRSPKKPKRVDRCLVPGRSRPSLC